VREVGGSVDQAGQQQREEHADDPRQVRDAVQRGWEAMLKASGVEQSATVVTLG
jgi:hypothetical protein